MALRLGELLVADRRLTPADVERALEMQRRSGGTIGSCLLALGLIDEATLAAVLARIFGVPAAVSADLLSAPPEVVSLLSAEFARRHRAIPFAVEGDRLLLALQNPDDALAAHEAAFLTGFAVAPHVAPEAAIRAALVRHHHVPGREPRAEFTTAPHAARPPAGGAGPDLVLAAGRLAEAEDRDAVLRVAAECAAAFLKRGMVFALRGGEAVMVQSLGFELAPGARIALRVSERSVLTPALERRVTCGPVEARAANVDFYALLGGRTPLIVLTAPVVVRGRTVLILYADDPEGRTLAPDLDQVRKLSSLLACALEMVILRAKMLRECVG